eukprot:COSAG02_NODE_45120_length_360_cov_0.597701_2_plen_88_part_01
MVGQRRRDGGGPGAGERSGGAKEVPCCAHLGESLLDGNVIDHPVADKAAHVAGSGHHGRGHRLGQRLQQHKQGGQEEVSLVSKRAVAQ